MIYIKIEFLWTYCILYSKKNVVRHDKARFAFGRLFLFQTHSPSCVYPSKIQLFEMSKILRVKVNALLYMLDYVRMTMKYL